MLKPLKHHLLTLHEKIGLLILYGIVMFCLGMGANYVFAPKPSPVPEQLAELPATPIQDAQEALEQEQAEEAALEPEQSGAALTEPEEETSAEYTTDLVVRKGDTITDLLIEAGIERKEAFDITTALGESYNLRQLPIGQKIQAVFREPESVESQLGGQLAEPRFVLLKIDELERVIELQRDAQGAFSMQVKPKKLRKELMHAEGVISSSLYVLAVKLTVPMNVLQDAVNAYSYDVDFQRDIQPGTKFGVLYETYYDEEGNRVREGDMLYATLTVDGDEMEIFRFSPTGEADDADYYTENGSGLRKALMKTPINGARISSPFGARKHPISGYTKMHKGVDFAAPRGTPVYAAGDAIITQIGWNGGYGNYVRLHHNADYDTAYGHLNRFAKGMKRGRRVKQGQVIAYVGSTGRSTGPHLHFEILVHGRQVNPISVKFTPARKLDGALLSALKAQVKQVRGWLATTSDRRLLPSGGKSLWR